MESSKEGWLVKQGHFVKNWKQRYFATRGEELIYRKEQKDETTLCGSINLNKCRLAPSHTNKKGFEILDVINNKLFILIAPSISEKEEWISVITRISNPQRFNRKKASSRLTSGVPPSFHQVRSRVMNPYKNPLPASLTGAKPPALPMAEYPSGSIVYSHRKWKIVGQPRMKVRVSSDSARVGQACQPYLAHCQKWKPRKVAESLLPNTGIIASELLQMGPPVDVAVDLRVPQVWCKVEEEEEEEEVPGEAEAGEEGAKEGEGKKEEEAKKRKEESQGEAKGEQGVKEGEETKAEEVKEGGEEKRELKTSKGEIGGAAEVGEGLPNGDAEEKFDAETDASAILTAGEWMEAYAVIMREGNPATRSSMLRALTADFMDLAVRTTKIIVHEIPLTQEEKTIKRLTGNKGLKYLSNGIFFTIAQDEEEVYGSDEYAMKAASNALIGAQAILNATFNTVLSPPLHVPLMAVITYLGFRVSAVAMLPISPTTLIHGSDDGGQHFVHASPEFENACCLIGKVLNLSQRRCGQNLDGKPGWVVGPFDLEGHFGEDSRFYFAQTSRLFPPEKPSEAHPSCMYRLLRPEFVMQYPYPLCPDGYLSKFNLTRESHDLDQATARLLNETIPSFAQNLPDMYESLYLLGPKHLIHLMHQAGINVRHIGRVRAHCPGEGPGVNVRMMLANQMVARAAKNVLRARLRAHITASTQKSDQLLETCRQLAVDFLEEWSRRPLWVTIFQYVQQHYLDPLSSPSPNTTKRSFSSDSGLRKSNNSQNQGKGGLQEGNGDVRTMEGLRKAINFNLVGPLFCELVGLQLTDDHLRWVNDMQLDSKKAAPLPDLPLPIIVPQVRSYSTAFRLMGDTIKGVAEKLLIEMNKERIPRIPDPRRPLMEEMKVALRLYIQAIQMDSLDLRSESSRLSLLETLEKSEERTFPHTLSQAVNRRKRYYTIRMRDTMFKELEEQIYDAMKDTLAQALVSIEEWKRFMAVEHTPDEIEEYQRKPERADMVAKLLTTTKNVIKVIAAYSFRPLPHSLHFPKILRVLGIAYRQMGLHSQAIAMLLYADKQLEICQRHMSPTDSSLLKEILAVVSSLADVLVTTGLYNDAVWWRIKHLRTIRTANDRDQLTSSYLELAKLLSSLVKNLSKILTTQGVTKSVNLAMQTWGIVLDAKKELLTEAKPYLLTCLEVSERRERSEVTQLEIDQIIKTSDEQIVFSSYCSLQHTLEMSNPNEKMLQMSKEILFGDGTSLEPPASPPMEPRSPTPNRNSVGYL